MSDLPSEVTPTREYYTAQELADIALEWGATATVTTDDEGVIVELTRNDASIQLVLGVQQDFYDDVLCRGWVFLEHAPHRVCDEWNRDPMFGTFSVVYDDHDLPIRRDGLFGVRGVRRFRFSHFRTEDELMTEIMLFWFGLSVLQDLAAVGRFDLRSIDFMDYGVTFSDWWFGRDETGDDKGGSDDVDG